MKHLKKITAIILAVCILVGMPLAVDVAAVGTMDATEAELPFNLTQALLVPQEWNTGLDPDRSLVLHFTDNVAIDIDNTKAYISLVNAKGLAAHVDPVTGKKNEGPIISVWSATLSRCEAFGSVNNYVATLDASQQRNQHELVDTIPEILDLADKTELIPVLRLRECSDIDDSGNQLPNTKVVSIYDADDTILLSSTPNGVDGGGCDANGQANITVNNDATEEEKTAGHAINCFDYFDIRITTLADAAHFEYAEYSPNGASYDFRFALSKGLKYDNRGSGHSPLHIRVVNSKGQIMYTNADRSKYRAEGQNTTGCYALGNFNNATSDKDGLNLEGVLPQGSTGLTGSLNSLPIPGWDSRGSGTLDWTATFNTCLTACNELNARNDGETYSVALVIEEKRTSTANGEASNNWRIDSLWEVGYIPLIATHNNPKLGVSDRVIIPILSSDQLGEAAINDPTKLALKNVSFVSKSGFADRVIIEFTKPVSDFAPSYSGLRIYDPRYVPRHSNTDMQWSVDNWKLYDATGTRWIGTMATAFNANTLAEAQEWLVNNRYATNTNGVFAMSGNYRLEFSIADNGADPKNNRLIDRIKATDGTVLFANDSLFGITEERAGIPWNQCAIYDSVDIEEVNIYDDKYVLIDFNQDVKVDPSLFYNALSIYDTVSTDLAGRKADKSEYGRYTLGTHFQRAFTSFTYYGNRKDVIVATLADGDYDWLISEMNDANAWADNNGYTDNRFQLRLRLQDFPEIIKASGEPNINYAIQGIRSYDNDYSLLYVDNDGDYSTLYRELNVNGKKIAQLTEVILSDSQQVVVSFSTPISKVEPSAFTLVNTDTLASYTASRADVNGTDVILTFPHAVFDENMIIRISGGANDLIPNSVVTTANGALIYANESASTAALKATVSEAVAQAKVNGKPFIYFKNAWAAKKNGDTVVLLSNQTFNSVLMINAGMTLDLNGYTLTTNHLLSFGDLIDSKDGTGLLRVDKEGANSFVLLQQDNTYLPLYDTAKTGYRFFTYDIVNRGTREVKDGDTVSILKFGIKFDFANPDAYTLLCDAANSDVSLTFNLTIRKPNASPIKAFYIFPHTSLSAYAKAVIHNTGNTLVLNVKGIPKIAEQVQSLPMSATLDAYSTLTSGTGMTRNSTQELYHVGISPAQAAFNWINTHINNHHLIGFSLKNYLGQDMSNLADTSYWTKPSITTEGTYDANHDWKRKIVYTTYLGGPQNTSSPLTLTLDISFNAKHAAIEWVGYWSYTGTNYSQPISNVRILYADLPVQKAIMTTARQGGQNYIYDYQPYSIDLTQNTSYTMQNSGGRSSQGAWPYFDLTSAHNTYGIMGAIGWSGNWNCSFTNHNNTVHVSVGMQSTNYQMKKGETLRTPSMVVQFFKGTQDDGHNAWRQLMLDQYTPSVVKADGTTEKVTYAPITISTWGGCGTDTLLATMNRVKETGQYFEYQWIDAGWYGDQTSENTYSTVWAAQRGNWYYNPGYADNQATTGGFDKLNAWHDQYSAETGRDTGLLVWFEPGYGTAESKMGESAKWDTPYRFKATYKETPDSTSKTETVSWQNGYFLPETAFVDYGNENALKFIKAVVLHFLDDMNCYFYRQDYNFNPQTGWSNKDANQLIGSLKYRTGVAEIQYVTGHYKFLDAIVASGRQIDNCASGGRLLDIEMMKRSIPLWRTDYTVTDSANYTVASGIRSQGANLSWWLPISGGMSSSEGISTEYTFRSAMASGIPMGVMNDQTFAKKMLDEMVHNRELMLGDYYILKQGLHESLKQEEQGTDTPVEKNPFDDYTCWVEDDPTKDYTDTTNAAYEFYREDIGEGYLVAFRPNFSDVADETFKLKGLDTHAYYEVKDADTGETSIHTGRYLMEQGLDLHFPDIRTSHMIYFTKQ